MSYIVKTKNMYISVNENLGNNWSKNLRVRDKEYATIFDSIEEAEIVVNEIKSEPLYSKTVAVLGAPVIYELRGEDQAEICIR